MTKRLRKTTEKGKDVFWFTIHQVLAHGQLALLLLGFGVNELPQSKAAYLMEAGNQGLEEARVLQGHAPVIYFLPLGPIS